MGSEEKEKEAIELPEITSAALEEPHHEQQSHPPDSSTAQHLLTEKLKAEKAHAEPTWKERISQFVDKYWFLMGLGFVVLIAWAYPPLGKKGGYLAAEYTVKYVAIALIFFLSGVSLKTNELVTAVKQWNIHVEVQVLNLVFCPVMFWAVVQFLRAVGVFPAVSPLADGLIVLGCLPTTISSAVLLTKSAGGNQPAALFNATVGNILGLFITPLWLLALLNTSSFGVSTMPDVLANLTETVIAPLIAGQLFQFYLKKAAKIFREKVNISKLNNAILLVIIYSTFCDTFSSNAFSKISNTSLTVVLIVTVLLHIIFLGITFGVGKLKIPKFTFDKPDRIAILLCATQKTAALGIPLINILFANDPTNGIKSLPLLVYHPTQVLVASLLVTPLQHWATKPEAATELPHVNPETPPNSPQNWSHMMHHSTIY